MDEQSQFAFLGEPAPAPSSVAAFAARWLETKCAPPYVRPYTAQVRAQFLRLYVLPALGEREITSITTADLDELQQDLIARRLAVSTTRALFSGVIGPMMRQARREGVIAELPEMRLHWPDADGPRPDPFTLAERDRILDFYAGKRPAWRALTGLVLLAGLRPSEAAGLDWDHVDVATGRVEIARSMVARVPGRPKTRAARRTIVVGDQLRRILADVRPARPASGELVACERDGRPLHSVKWSQSTFHRHLDGLGIRGRGLYCGRHTFISIAVSVLDANIARVAAYCGTSVKRIESNYLRWLTDLTDPTAQQVSL